MANATLEQLHESASKIDVTELEPIRLDRSESSEPAEYSSDVDATFKSLGLLGQVKLRKDLAWKRRVELDQSERMKRVASLGFKHMTPEEACTLMTGQTGWKSKIIDNQFVSWHVNVDEWRTPIGDSDVSPLNGGHICMPIFELSCGWIHKTRMVFCGPERLKAQIPYGVALRMKELARCGTFDTFQVVAPRELVDVNPPSLDPVVLGCFTKQWNPYSDLGRDASDFYRYAASSYFIAKW